MQSVPRLVMAMPCLLLAGAMLSNAQSTVTVGPSGQYPSPCAAFPNLHDGDTVLVDANGGIPYDENGYSNGAGGCFITANNLTITGVNGRPVLDGAGQWTSKALWVIDGHDIVIDNFEFRNALEYGSGNNAEAMRIEDGTQGNNVGGGNVTIQHSYIHNCQTGLLTGSATGGLNWNSANPYVTLQYDEFAYNGDDNGNGDTHNIYIGYGGNLNFTIQYTWSHDSLQGHTLKMRSPIENVYYNMFTDAENDGDSSDLLDNCNGGSLYAVGNVFYKAAVPDWDAGTIPQHWMIYYDGSEDGAAGADTMYGPANQDFHFINNTVVIDPNNTTPAQFISLQCRQASNVANCPAPAAGSPSISVNAVIENNIFIGPSGNQISNQPSAHVAGNVVETYSDAALAAMFVDWTHYDFHLASGAPAIKAGIYPPTDNNGNADSKALATAEFVLPGSGVARPTPSGSTMDAGAYSYPRVDTPASPSVSYTTSVNGGNSGSITISGLPTPASGSYNYASFATGNSAVILEPTSVDSSTGTLTATFTTNPVSATTTVPIDIYTGGAHTTATVTVNVNSALLGTTTLVNVNSGLCLSDPSGSTTAGTQMVQASCDGGAEQNWTVTLNSDGNVSIKNQASGLCLYTNNQSWTNGNQIVQQGCNGQDPGAVFYLHSSPAGGYQIVTGSGGNIATTDTGLIFPDHREGSCVEVSGGSTSSGAGIDQSNCTNAGSQAWTFNGNGSSGGSGGGGGTGGGGTSGSGAAPLGRRIAILSTVNNNYLGIDSSTSNLEATFSGIGLQQMFNAVDAGNGYFGLQSLFNNDYVSVNLNDNDVAMALWATSIGSWETFNWNKLGSSTFAIFSTASNYYLSNNLNNSNIEQASWSTSPGSWETYSYVDLGATGGPPVGRCIAIVSASDSLYLTHGSGDNIQAIGTSVGNPQLYDVVSAGSGNSFALKSLDNGYYVSVDLGYESIAMARWATSVGSWETLTWDDLGGNKFAMFSSAAGYYLTNNSANNIQASTATTVGNTETYTWIDEGPAR